MRKSPKKSLWADLPALPPYQTTAPTIVDPVPQTADGAPLAHVEKWERIRTTALAEYPDDTEEFAALMWVERRCVEAGLHAMDEWWKWHLREFYTSGKRIDLGRVGLRGAKSDTICRAIVSEVLMTPRIVEPGLVAACPVISRNVAEANDRTDTIVQVLSACGITDKSGKRDGEEPGAFVRSGGGFGARVVKLFDAQGHPVEFRIYPPSIAAAAGYTAIAGFADEVDLWGKDEHANPAERVFEILFTRFITQPRARLHVMSASYYSKTTHSRMIDGADTPLQRVARLGKVGAEKDTEIRQAFAAKHPELSPDERRILTDAARPDQVDVPSWVTNPIVPIEEAFKLCKNNVRLLMNQCGGGLAAGGVTSLSIDEYTRLGELNRGLAADVAAHRGRVTRVFREDGLIDVPGFGADFKPIPGFGGKTRGRL